MLPTKRNKNNSQVNNRSLTSIGTQLIDPYHFLYKYCLKEKIFAFS